MVKSVKFLSRLLNASCSDVITVPLFSCFLPNRPRPLSSFTTYARWQPVTQSARSRWSYGKTEDCHIRNNCDAWSCSATETTASRSRSRKRGHKRAYDLARAIQLWLLDLVNIKIYNKRDGIGVRRIRTFLFSPDFDAYVRSAYDQVKARLLESEREAER